MSALSCRSCGLRFRAGERCPLCRLALDQERGLAPGTEVAGFTIREEVASGPLATVYRGVGPGGAEVAIKIYRAGLSGGVRQRAAREAEVLARVRHPGVAGLVRRGRTADGAELVISEWIAGRGLHERLTAGPLGWDELAEVLTALAAGLTAIHAAGLVHRDLKPANIVLAARPRPPAVILDLGHALPLTESRLTSVGVVVGSAAYMAPEQAAGAALDGRADLYALGVIVYQALTGALPFAGASPAETMRCHLDEPVIPPTRRAPLRRIPPAAEDLCLWLLAKDPAARLPSAQVLALTLRAMRVRPIVQEIAS